MIFGAGLLRMHEGSRRSGSTHWRTRGFRRCFDFPVASLFHAGAENAGLGALFDDERSAAFRAWLVERLVRRSVIAIGIAAAAVKYSAASASFGCAATNEFAFAALRALDA